MAPIAEIDRALRRSEAYPSSPERDGIPNAHKNFMVPFVDHSRHGKESEQLSVKEYCCNSHEARLRCVAVCGSLMVLP